MNLPDLVTLANDDLEVVVDPGRGSDILTLRHVGTGVDVMFSTPWRERADQIRSGAAATTTYGDVAPFLEQYRGGSNTLCPNAGPPRVVHGAPIGFHGEAAAARWEVISNDATQLQLRVALYTVPVVIERHISLVGSELRVEDQVTNDSDVELEIDYVAHPAYGGAFLEDACTVDTNARSFTADPGTADGLKSLVDLREVPAPGTPQMAFGWLSDFDGDPWAAITNQDLGLTIKVSWDSTHQPYAWFWQELNWTEGFPWHRRARALAIEPSSTITSGPDRKSVLTLAPRQSVRIPLTLNINTLEDPS